ncbi:MAG: hypothetical protein KAQ62_18810, partial [Cyclobacteriaceae bacterium]|nr:hypothetical protein [Cyclobacteriaceae bacterium]
NFRDDQEFAKLINDERTIKNLGKNLGKIKARLTYDPELEHLANKFDTTNINQREEIRRMAADKNEVIYQRMMQLFKIENDIIGSTIEAGIKLSKFLKNSQKETKLAIESFQQFGSVLTESFNRDTGFKLIAKRKDYTRYIGPELFIAVAQALDKNVSVNTQGSLEFIVLKKKSTFKIESYLDGKVPPDEDIIVSQRIVDIS